MYNIFDKKKHRELSLVRHGWFLPEYKLTDDVNIYGKIAYHLFSKARATAESTSGIWLILPEDDFTLTTLITDENDFKIGEITRDLLSHKSTLTLQSGFSADFYPTSFFSRTNIWESEAYGKILQIKSSLFNLNDNIFIEESPVPAALIPPLILLGEHLIIRRMRRSK